MAWLHIEKAPLGKSEKRDVPDGLWIRCDACQAILYRKEFEGNLCVCPKCEHHHPISARARINSFVDPESFVELDENLQSLDPLAFKDKKSYQDRLKASQKETGSKDAIVCGEGLLFGRKIHLGVYDFQFMGGSMGVVVGEKITRTFLRAHERGEPAIIFSTSGGARMHEGILSLMQMGKTCTALAMMRDKGVPMISVMTHPTTGGVAASYATLGDINLGEPKALIGFAGPRVIQQTIGQSLPEGFQTAEYLLEHGMLDRICHRREMRTTIAKILDLLCP